MSFFFFRFCFVFFLLSNALALNSLFFFFAIFPSSTDPSGEINAAAIAQQRLKNPNLDTQRRFC